MKTPMSGAALPLKRISTIPKDHQILKAACKGLQELETKYMDMKTENDGYKQSVKENKEKIAELSLALEKKAANLELKKLNGAIDDANERNNDVKKEMEQVKKALKMLEENEEIKSVKLKCTSLEGKINTILKNMKDLQTKMLENMNMQIIPQVQSDTDEKKEEQLRQFMDETRDKLNALKTASQAIKKEFTDFSSSITAKLSRVADLDLLIELESIVLIKKH